MESTASAERRRSVLLSVVDGDNFREEFVFERRSLNEEEQEVQEEEQERTCREV